MKHILAIIALAFLASCSSGILYTGKKGRWVGGNYAHFQKRAELKAEKKAMREMYGKY